MFFFFYFFWDSVTVYPSWPQIHIVAQASTELLVPRLSLPSDYRQLLPCLAPTFLQKLMEPHVSMLWSRVSVFKCQLLEAYGGCYCCVEIKYREERDSRAPRGGCARHLAPCPQPSLCAQLCMVELNYACQTDFLTWLLAQCYQLKGRVRLCQPRKVWANLPPRFWEQQRGNRDVASVQAAGLEWAKASLQVQAHTPSSCPPELAPNSWVPALLPLFFQAPLLHLPQKCPKIYIIEAGGGIKACWFCVLKEPLSLGAHIE